MTLDTGDSLASRSPAASGSITSTNCRASMPMTRPRKAAAHCGNGMTGSPTRSASCCGRSWPSSDQPRTPPMKRPSSSGKPRMSSWVAPPMSKGLSDPFSEPRPEQRGFADPFAYSNMGSLAVPIRRFSHTGSAGRPATARPCRPATVFDFRRSRVAERQWDWSWGRCLRSAGSQTSPSGEQHCQTNDCHSKSEPVHRSLSVNGRASNGSRLSRIQSELSEFGLIGKIMGGNPAFRGTREPVHMLAELVPSRVRAHASPEGKCRGEH